MTHRKLLFSVVSVSLALAGCPTTPAPADSGTPDTGGGVDAPMVDAPRPDTSLGPDALGANRAAVDAFTPEFCACVAMLGDVTEAQCIENSARDVEFDACERMAYDAARAGLTAYYECLTMATNDRRTCFAAADCTDETAIAACNMAATAANDACGDLITDDAQREIFVTTNNECIADTIIGPAGGSCYEAGAVSSGVGMSVFSGDTTLGGDHTDPTPSCVAFRLADADEAADRAHRWEAPSDGLYRFDTLGSDFDTVLYIRDVSMTCVTTQHGCNDDIEAGVMVQSQVDVMMTAGQQVVVVVDGFGLQARGAYEVNITYLGAGGDAGPGTDGGMGGSDAGMPTDAGTPVVEVLPCTGLTPVATIDATTGAYVPATSTVNVGDVVQFIPGSSFHNMVSTTAGVPDGVFMTPLGSTVCLRFNAMDTYDFACEIHGFTGSITVN